jgi:membrane associated rhomboid family serine protease
MFFPIRTDSPIRRTPVANYVLIALNLLVYWAGQVTSAWEPLADDYFVLHADAPRLHEFITYQFLHGGPMHLIGNMIFLWVFGNAVNAKMGHATYALFYLAGGAFAGVGFAFFSDHALIGASGSIAAVTTAYLALFPRSHITFLYWLIFIGFIDLPSMLIITFKIVLWDNIIAPSWFAGESSVAYSAHLAGYGFGFVVACGMLFLRALPRDQFDIIALWKRWHQRRTFETMMRSPEAQAQAQFGRVAARPVRANSPELKAAVERLDRVTELRAQIYDAMNANDRAAAAMLYEELMAVDPQQVLSEQHMLEIGGEFYAMHRYPQAAACYERFLQRYPRSGEANHVRLLLGIIYARDLQHYEAAEKHLRESMEKLTDTRRREQCDQWLQVVVQALGRAKPGTA